MKATDNMKMGSAPREKTIPIQRFRIILDALKGGEITTVVPRALLLEALDDYEAKGFRWMVVGP